MGPAAAVISAARAAGSKPEGARTGWVSPSLVARSSLSWDRLVPTTAAPKRPASWSRSARLMPAPATRTRTSWSPGSGTGRSSTTRRPPSWMTRARMAGQPNRRSQPALGLAEEVAAHRQAAFEGLAHGLLALEDLPQGNLLAGHHQAES